MTPTAPQIIYIATNLAHLRKNILDNSQDELSKKLGIVRSSLSAYEIGKIEPNLAILIKLSNFWFINIDRLITTDLTIYNKEGLSKFREEYEICRQQKNTTK